MGSVLGFSLSPQNPKFLSKLSQAIHLLSYLKLEDLNGFVQDDFQESVHYFWGFGDRTKYVPRFAL